jgi:hypothetical protein
MTLTIHAGQGRTVTTWFVEHTNPFAAAKIPGYDIRIDNNETFVPSSTAAWLSQPDAERLATYLMGVGSPEERTARVNQALRAVITNLDYDLHKELAFGEDGRSDPSAYDELTATFLDAYTNAEVTL